MLTKEEDELMVSLYQDLKELNVPIEIIARIVENMGEELEKCK